MKSIFLRNSNCKIFLGLHYLDNIPPFSVEMFEPIFNDPNMQHKMDFDNFTKIIRIHRYSKGLTVITEVFNFGF